MRDWKKNKIINFMSVIILAVSLLSGCKQDRLEENTKDLQENVSQQEDVSGLRKMFRDTEWKKEWKAVTENGNNRNIAIDADIIVPDLDTMSVIEIENLTFTNENKEMFLRGLFGDSDIYYNDDAHKTKEQWKKKIREDVLQYIEEYEYWIAVCQDEEEKQGYRECISQLQNMRADYEEKMKEAKAEYTKADNFDVDSYLGYINGQPYTMIFEKEKYDMGDSDGNEFGFKENSFIVKLSDYDKMLPDELKNAVEVHSQIASDIVTDEGETIQLSEEKNRCEMSKKEAESYARRYLDSAGIPGAVCTYIEDLYWIGTQKDDVNNTYSEVYIPDGYEIRFTVGIDNISLESFGTENEYMSVLGDSALDNLNVYSMKSEVVMKVSDAGLLCMRVGNPIKICNITSDVELLPLDNICEIIRDEMTKHPMEYGTVSQPDASTSYNELKLIYFRVIDKERENHFSYIPIWRLGITSDGYIYKAAFVNAIDGSVIHLLDELGAEGKE